MRQAEKEEQAFPNVQTTPVESRPGSQPVTLRLHLNLIPILLLRLQLNLVPGSFLKSIEAIVDVYLNFPNLAKFTL
eukprot:SAG31_NODE_101_length_25195_cov_67.436758_2_plen_76_part_00